MLIYRLLLTLAAPVVACHFLLRRLRGAESAADLRERLARGPAAAGRPLWIHGASNGELTAARPLIDTLLQEPELALLITTNTATARALVESWGLPRTSVCMAPFDLRATLRRFFARHRPRALLVIENELWPNRLVMAHERGLPVAVISARLSQGSARNWARLPGLSRRLLSTITLLSAQDGESAARFTRLGLPPAVLAPPLALKSLATPDAPAAADLAALAPAFQRPDTILAASTHEGEEASVLRAFLSARAERPALRLILAPRHPRRGPEVARLITGAGLTFATRSRGEPPGDAPVYLADTMGEMNLWYALAGICFTGGSLVEKGGHTPWEPVHFGCALLHGPSSFNQREAFAALDAAGGALEVADEAALAMAFGALDATRQEEMARRARKVAERERADLASLQARLRSALGLTG